jgi:hypothetical protein
MISPNATLLKGFSLSAQASISDTSAHVSVHSPRGSLESACSAVTVVVAAAVAAVAAVAVRVTSRLNHCCYVSRSHAIATEYHTRVALALLEIS